MPSDLPNPSTPDNEHTKAVKSLFAYLLDAYWRIYLAGGEPPHLASWMAEQFALLRETRLFDQPDELGEQAELGEHSDQLDTFTADHQETAIDDLPTELVVDLALGMIGRLLDGVEALLSKPDEGD